MARGGATPGAGRYAPSFATSTRAYAPAGAREGPALQVFQSIKRRLALPLERDSAGFP